MSEMDFAWAAGYFEGEGSIVFGPRKGGVRRRLTLGSTDEDVIKRFHRIVQVGNLTGPYPRLTPAGGPAKPMWNWAVNRWEDLEPLLKRLLPFLGERRAEVALRLLATPSLGPGRKRP